jgi:hypothetical protein
MTKASEAPHPAAAPAMPPGWWNAGSFEPYFGAFGNWMRDLARLQRESMHFVLGRMQKNIEAATALAACRSPGDMIELQSRYASEMMSDYAGEGRKVFELLKH